jgi:uncharacterized protein
MNHYIIDGNNLIGKIKSLHNLPKRDKQSSRGGLVSFLNASLAGKKIKLTLHLDGFAGAPLHLAKGHIIYSQNRTSDHFIRKEIDESKNPKLITLVTSDHSLMNYGRVNSCKVIRAEDFYKEIENSGEKNIEQEKVKSLEKDKDLFLKLFS